MSVTLGKILLLHQNQVYVKIRVLCEACRHHSTRRHTPRKLAALSIPHYEPQIIHTVRASLVVTLILQMLFNYSHVNALLNYKSLSLSIVL
jgi:hypothetical protein